MFSPEEIQSLNELEFLLYNYISKNKDKVIYMRIRDLADEVHVSTTTILRFCKKMNCNGFAEFKVKLKMFIEEEEGKLLNDDKSTFIEFMNRAATKDFEDSMKMACDAIYKSNNLLIIGIGNSGAIATYGSRYFASLNKFAVYIDDPFYPVSGEYLDNGVTIALSVSGETPTIINHVTRLKKKNSTIISITNSKSCTLAQMSDINISYYVQYETYKYFDITTQLPVMYILETLAKRVFNLTQKDKNKQL
ncbi:MurR/RpiR family transcriptional regulator [Clostridium intestinale]|jgi:DNA-binding MurR/RpiR family transcriptional regulator|uniref:Transcriptional regulator, RpiR family protein n=2 Tax=Clostridium intestinale TaxID=36845 RepID=U2NSX7_9CLOT|nr:MurR/RpiR family transcriptional regulator [Clostridium intestinale]ERK32288.1 transcriptional regulator, RpiR family protein [Clostridium intestinale URNW]QLY79407.1 MurR/RpiR family transcriptional regulator [Clostridium intestinale]